MVGIGKEKPKLKAKAVVVVRHEIVTVPAKEGTKLKDDKQKVVLCCKHPDRVDPVELSRVKYERQGKMQNNALWLSTDEDGNIAYDSALANLMRFYEVEELEQIDGKTIQTVTDNDTGFLIVKSY